MRMRAVMSLLTLLLCVMCLNCSLVTGSGPSSTARPEVKLPTNNDPRRQIRFHTPDDADAKRRELIGFIWPDGLPSSILPGVTKDVPFPGADLDSADPLFNIDRTLISRVDKVDAEVSGMHYRATSYLLYPTNTVNESDLVILHSGHAESWNYGSLSLAAVRLLKEGFTVAAMMMPAVPPNAGVVVVVPGGDSIAVETHEEFFTKLDPILGKGAALRFFLEPVVQTINHFLASTPDAGDVSMIGLSGGGWTTNMMAAMDERITLSVPVAGSAPLYVRNAKPDFLGDAEQYYLPLYDEDIARDGTGGGVATWLEIYALGGYGDGRRQIFVSNLYDVWFSGRFADSFKDIVARTVSNELGMGQWSYFLDATHGDRDHPEHHISSYVVDQIILPALKHKER